MMIRTLQGITKPKLPPQQPLNALSQSSPN
jgi:hypothetical protein